MKVSTAESLKGMLKLYLILLRREISSVTLSEKIQTTFMQIILLAFTNVLVLNFAAYKDIKHHQELKKFVKGHQNKQSTLYKKFISKALSNGSRKNSLQIIYEATSNSCSLYSFLL